VDDSLATLKKLDGSTLEMRNAKIMELVDTCQTLETKNTYLKTQLDELKTKLKEVQRQSKAHHA
jgi:hypothetical protein